LSGREFGARLQLNWSRGRPDFESRIAIHSGPAVVGSVGAETRLQYMGMGDTINLASRLEGMNKIYGTTILISQAVNDGRGPDFVTRVLDTVQVKRRAEARSPSISLLNLDHRRSQPSRRADIDPAARWPSP
jgi:adenylate cyclase